jgi:hypothetical protein
MSLELNPIEPSSRLADALGRKDNELEALARQFREPSITVALIKTPSSAVDKLNQVVTSGITVARAKAIQGSEFGVRLVLRIPKNEIGGGRQKLTGCASCLSHGNDGDRISATEHLIHDRAQEVYVLVTDLHENTSTLHENVAGKSQSFPKIRQVRMDAELPGVPERPDLFGLSRHILCFCILHISSSR